MTRDRDLPPFAALDCDVFNNSVWPSVRHNRQFFPKGAPIMSEGSLATGVWIITQGCAARTITAASGNARQQQLAVETLVPGQSVGWEELTLQLRPDFARQVNSPPSSPPSLPPLPPLFFSAHTFSHGCTAGSRHKHIERRCPDRRPHYFCP